jgi:hypothetical protein
MDDQLLEKRLDSLKKAYDEMPEDENRSAILAAIKKDQKKKRQNKWFHLPYAASFIGVGMIAGILIMQHVDENNFTYEKLIHYQNAGTDEKQGSLTEKDIIKEFDWIRNYFSEQQAETEERLGFGGEERNIIGQNMLREINDDESNIILSIDNTNQDELQQIKQKYKVMIDTTFDLPSDIIAQLTSGEKEKYGDMALETQLLQQLEFYQSAYWQSTILSSWEIDSELKKESAYGLAEKLNAGDKEINNATLKNIASGAKKNGYYFTADESGIRPEINYNWVIEQLDPEENYDFIRYLELRKMKIHDNNGKVSSYKDLGDLLVLYEKRIGSLHNSAILEWMRNEALSYYAEYVLGKTPSPLFDEHNMLREEVKQAYLHMIKVYPETDTGIAIKDLYEKLEANNFKKPEGYGDRGVEGFPEYMNISRNKKAEDMINRKVLPLSDSLLSSYKEFAAKKDYNLLKDYGPFEIMQLYFHADQTGDYETSYALYSKNGGQPPEEQYIKEMKAAGMNLSEILDGYDYATLYHSNDDPEKVIGIQLHFKNTTNSPVFQVVEEDDFWKVQFLPLQ